MHMRWDKTIAIICLVVMIITAFEYINLMSLYKDAVDDASLYIKTSDTLTEQKKKKALEEINEYGTKLIAAKKTVVVLFWISLGGFLITGYYWAFKKRNAGQT